MRQKLNYILTITLFLIIISCKNENKENFIKLKTDSTSVNNSNKNEIINIEQPKETVFRNLEIDTAQLFGTWTQDPTSIFADFQVNKKSFNIIDYDGEGEMPYILEKNKIIVFFRNTRHKGTITSTENDTLKIKWSDNQTETEYVKSKK